MAEAMLLTKAVDREHTIAYPSFQMEKRSGVPNQPHASAKNVTGDFDKFQNFMRRLVAVPHSEIKAAMEAEKREKKASSSSRVPVASRKH